jgi:hypothetical protein
VSWKCANCGDCRIGLRERADPSDRLAAIQRDGARKPV